MTSTCRVSPRSSGTCTASSGESNLNASTLKGNPHIALENNAANIGDFLLTDFPNDAPDQAAELASSLYFMSEGVLLSNSFARTVTVYSNGNTLGHRQRVLGEQDEGERHRRLQPHRRQRHPDHVPGSLQHVREPGRRRYSRVPPQSDLHGRVDLGANSDLPISGRLPAVGHRTGRDGKCLPDRYVHHPGHTGDHVRWKFLGNAEQHGNRRGAGKPSR